MFWQDKVEKCILQIIYKLFETILSQKRTVIFLRLFHICSITLTAKLMTREKASLRIRNTLSVKCDQFYVDNFSLPVSLAATRVVPIPFPRALTRSADLAFSLSRCSLYLLFLTFEWMDILVVDDVCYILHTLHPACLLVTSWYLVSSRSKFAIAFVCSDSVVRTGRTRQYFSMAAGCWLMPVKDLVLASRLHVFSNVVSLQTPLNWASVWRTAICPHWMPSIWSDLV